MLVFVVCVTGCFWGGGKPAPPPQTAAPKPVEIIDLDKVLTALSETLDGMDLALIGRTPDNELGQMAAVPKDQEKENMTAGKRLDPKERDQFLAAFTERLNKIQPMSKHFGVFFDGMGGIVGFADDNRNKTKDGPEQELFKVFIDRKQKRLLAADIGVKETHHRDYPYGDFIPGSFTHRVLGTLLNDQMEKGVDTSKFSEIKVSPKDYHKKLSQRSAPQPPQPPPGK
jgi:hypothetical protein